MWHWQDPTPKVRNWHDVWSPLDGTQRRAAAVCVAFIEKYKKLRCKVIISLRLLLHSGLHSAVASNLISNS